MNTRHCLTVPSVIRPRTMVYSHSVTQCITRLLEHPQAELGDHYGACPEIFNTIPIPLYASSKFHIHQATAYFKVHNTQVADPFEQELNLALHDRLLHVVEAERGCT